MYSGNDFPDGSAVGSDAPGGSAVRQTPKVSAGFGSPADDATVKRIDLNDALIRNAQATFVMRAKGDAMHGMGIDDGDVLLVDRAVRAVHGHVIVASVDGDLICRRLSLQGKRVSLCAANPEHADLLLETGAALDVWGVVTTIIKSLPV